ncbi:MAG: hypothetical protein MK132_24055 [Lentisphaerales bacterium]|nr:hypothetical protein [Lentisphaerales bacterium]
MAFHGTDDGTIEYRINANLFKELKNIEANVKFTTIDNIGHAAASYAFTQTGDKPGTKTQYASTKCDQTDNSIDWLFKQKLKP